MAPLLGDRIYPLRYILVRAMLELGTSEGYRHLVRPWISAASPVVILGLLFEVDHNYDM